MFRRRGKSIVSETSLRRRERPINELRPLCFSLRCIPLFFLA
jgi:hypothetical protein